MPPLCAHQFPFRIMELFFFFLFLIHRPLAGLPRKNNFLLLTGGMSFCTGSEKHWLVFKSGKSYYCRPDKVTSCHNGLAVSTSDSRCGDPGSSLAGGPFFSSFVLSFSACFSKTCFLGHSARWNNVLRTKDWPFQTKMLKSSENEPHLLPTTRLTVARGVLLTLIHRSSAVAWVDSSWSESRTLLGRCFGFCEGRDTWLGTSNLPRPQEKLALWQIDFHFQFAIGRRVLDSG